jgi:hypothetical protein
VESANQVPRSINPSPFSRIWSRSKMRSKEPSLVHVRYQWYLDRLRRHVAVVEPVREYEAPLLGELL